MRDDANRLKETGNENFEEKKWKLAQDKYEEAIKVLGGWAADKNNDINLFRPDPKYKGIFLSIFLQYRRLRIEIRI